MLRRSIIAEKKPELEAAAAAERLKTAEQVAALQAQVDELRKVAEQAVAGAKQARASLLEAGGLDAARDWEREGQMARALQSFALSRLALAQIAMHPRVIENLGRIIVASATRGDLDGPTAIRYARHLGQDAKAVAELCEISQNVTRRYLGAPSEIVRHQHEHAVVTMTVGELEEAQARTARIVEQLKEHGDAAVIEAEAEPVAALPPPEDEGEPE